MRMVSPGATCAAAVRAMTRRSARISRAMPACGAATASSRPSSSARCCIDLLHVAVPVVRRVVRHEADPRGRRPRRLGTAGAGRWQDREPRRGREAPARLVAAVKVGRASRGSGWRAASSPLPASRRQRRAPASTSTARAPTSSGNSAQHATSLPPEEKRIEQRPAFAAHREAGDLVEAEPVGRLQRGEDRVVVDAEQDIDVRVGLQGVEAGAKRGMEKPAAVDPPMADVAVERLGANPARKPSQRARVLGSASSDTMRMRAVSMRPARWRAAATPRSRPAATLSEPR